MITVFVVI